MLSFSTNPRFAHLDRAELDRIEALTKLDQFAAGDTIWRAGDPSEWLGTLFNGEAEYVLESGGKRHVLAVVKAGDLYGELEMFADLPPGVRLVARTDVLSRVCPKDPLRQDIRQHRELAVGLLFAFARSMSEKIRHSTAAMVAAGPAARPKAPSGRHLNAEERAWLAMLGRTVESADGDALVKEGDATRSFFVIEKGLAEVRKSNGGTQQVLVRLHEGDLFGFLAFLDGQPRSASVVAVDGPITAVEVQADALESALKVNFAVAFRFLGTLCRVLGRTFADNVSALAD